MADIDNIALMKAIKRHPVIYDRNLKDFKDLKTKEAAWRDIVSEIYVGVDFQSHSYTAEADIQKYTQSLKTRYNTVRTRFSKYLFSIRGSSGIGSIDNEAINIKPEFEHLRWLISYISHRPTTTARIRNKKFKFTSNPDSQPANVMDRLRPDDDDDEADCDSTALAMEDEEIPNGIHVVLSGEADSENAFSCNGSLVDVPELPNPDVRGKVGTWSTGIKHQPSSTQMDAMILMELQSLKEEQKRDADTMFLLSLAPGLKGLNSQQKWKVKIAMMKALNDAEVDMMTPAYQNHQQQFSQIPSQSFS